MLRYTLCFSTLSTIKIISVRKYNVLCNHLLIHDLEKAVEIKNKGIKHGYIVKYEHFLDNKMKYSVNIELKRKNL